MAAMPARTLAGRPLDPGFRRAVAVTAAVALVLFLVAVWAVRADTFADLDRAARAAIREGRAIELDASMRLVSDLATGYVLLPVTVAGSVVLWRRGHRGVARALPAIGIGTAALLALTKWVVGKPRPSLRGYGFPSGHVFGVTVFVLITLYVLWLAGVPRRWLLGVGGAGLAFIGAVAYSRLHVGAHWPSDVLGGAVYGIAFALLMMLCLDARAR
jgi:undecaprenyl-diphosphatase